MDQSVFLLEQKLEQFLAYCEGLRSENQDLRSRIGHLEEENQALLAKIDSARHRLEALMEKIPVDPVD